MYTLSEEYLNEILAYLAEKPYKEVAKLVYYIQSADKIIKSNDDESGYIKNATK